MSHFQVTTRRASQKKGQCVLSGCPGNVAGIWSDLEHRQLQNITAGDRPLHHSEQLYICLRQPKERKYVSHEFLEVFLLKLETLNLKLYFFFFSIFFHRVTKAFIISLASKSISSAAWSKPSDCSGRRSGSCYVTLPERAKGPGSKRDSLPSPPLEVLKPNT